MVVPVAPFSRSRLFARRSTPLSDAIAMERPFDSSIWHQPKKGHRRIQRHRNPWPKISRNDAKCIQGWRELALPVVADGGPQWGIKTLRGTSQVKIDVFLAMAAPCRAGWLRPVDWGALKPLPARHALRPRARSWCVWRSSFLRWLAPRSWQRVPLWLRYRVGVRCWQRHRV